MCSPGFLRAFANFAFRMLLHHHNPWQLLWVHGFHCIGVNCHVSSLSKYSQILAKNEATLVSSPNCEFSNQILFCDKTLPATMLALGVEKEECQELTNNWSFNDITIITNDRCSNFAITRSSYILQQPCRTCWFRLPQRPACRYKRSQHKFSEPSDDPTTLQDQVSLNSTQFGQGFWGYPMLPMFF